MSHERNHLNAALIIKRFEITENLKKEFPNKYISPKNKAVLKIEKKILLEKENISKNDHFYTHSRANCFTKKNLYTIDVNCLNIFSENEKISDEFKKVINEVESKSLEINLGIIESQFSSLLDKHLKDNFKKINKKDNSIILNFIDSSLLRAYKFSNIKNFLKKSYHNDYINESLTQNKTLKQYENNESFIESLSFKDTMIYLMANEDYLEDQIILLLRDLKNKELLKNIATLEKEQLLFVENNNSEFQFLLGDNLVYTIYNNGYNSPLKNINKYLKKYNIIKENLNKIDIMVLSPYNIIIKTDKIDVNKYLLCSKEFVKVINSLTLFISDEWIVYNNIICNKNKIINIDLFNNLKIYDFLSKNIAIFLYNSNYDVGLPNRFKEFEDKILNVFLKSIKENLNEYDKQIQINLTTTDNLYLKKVEDDLIYYLYIKTTVLIREHFKNEKKINMYIGNSNEKLCYHISRFNKYKDYDVVIIEICTKK